jgi:GAF domain-containing protein
MIGAIIDPDERPSNRLAVEGRPIECHLDDSDLPPAEREALERYGEKTTLDFPLEYQGEVIGILGLIELDHVRRFTFEERALFEQLGVLASIAIHNARL